jgi:hypothetical protein
VRARLDALRPLLGIVFLAGYAWQTFAPGSFGTDLFLGVGAVLFVISVPWSSAFHRAFALAAFVALAVVIFTGRSTSGTFYKACLRTSGSWLCCSSSAWLAIRSRQPAMRSRSGPSWRR